MGQDGITIQGCYVEQKRVLRNRAFRERCIVRVGLRDAPLIDGILINSTTKREEQCKNNLPNRRVEKILGMCGRGPSGSKRRHILPWTSSRSESTRRSSTKALAGS